MSQCIALVALVTGFDGTRIIDSVEAGHHFPKG